jgi:hypothetical protein
VEKGLLVVAKRILVTTNSNPNHIRLIPDSGRTNSNEGGELTMAKAKKKVAKKAAKKGGKKKK